MRMKWLSARLSMFMWGTVEYIKRLVYKRIGLVEDNIEESVKQEQAI